MRTPTGMAKPDLMAGGELMAFVEPPSVTDLCERAVQAIWKSLDAHDLVNHEVRDRLAEVLDPLTELPLGGRPQRLIRTLRMPDPIDAAQLYWLTRRLLTLVPELQALSAAAAQAHSGPPAPRWN